MFPIKCPKDNINLVRCSSDDNIYYCKMCGKFYCNGGISIRLATREEYNQYRKRIF